MQQIDLNQSLEKESMQVLQELLTQLLSMVMTQVQTTSTELMTQQHTIHKEIDLER
jgi:hypothetical protein